jgi:hypothetical protein
MRILEVHTDYDWALVREAELIGEYPNLVNHMPHQLSGRAFGFRYYRDVPAVLNPMMAGANGPPSAAPRGMFTAEQADQIMADIRAMPKRVPKGLGPKRKSEP